MSRYWAPGAEPPGLLVLCWHNVEGTWCFPSRSGWGRRGLAAQLRLLQWAANVVPLDDALTRLQTGVPLPPRPVALTFDDGYADNLTLAVPMLERLGLPATFFLVPSLLSGTSGAWWETTAWAFATAARKELSWEGRIFPLEDRRQRRAAYTRVAESLKSRDAQARAAAVGSLTAALQPAGRGPGAGLYLDWAGAAELTARGFTVGSHTLTHAILSQESATEQERDLAASRALLSERLHVPVELLAYPNGTPRDFTETTTAAAARAGYQAAVTTIDGFNRASTPAFEIRRSVLYPERGALDLAMTLRDARRGG